MAKKINQQEAQALITRALQVQQKCPTQRFGQCLWNLLCEDHEDLNRAHLATDRDFFYEKDSQVVIEVFFEHYVEKEND